MVLLCHCMILLDSDGGLAKLWKKNYQQIIVLGNWLDVGVQTDSNQEKI